MLRPMPKLERRAYYDAEPRYQREKTPEWYQQSEKTNESMRESLKEFLTPKKSVLEIGCGGGGLAEFILKTGVKAYSGFDFSETAVTNARQRLGEFEEARIWRSDALDPKTYSKKYDCLVAHQFLHCLIGPDRAKWFSLCRTAIHPDGVLVFSTMVGVPPRLAEAYDSSTKQNKMKNRYFADENEIKAEIAAAGFELEHVIHPEENSAIFVAGPVIS